VNWGVYGVPETFVVDGEGRIVARLAEPLTEDALTRRLRPALEQAEGQ
jgi:cytochrome c biogenesis protein CcmG/thiol:disulfide interchange protein DsbE